MEFENENFKDEKSRIQFLKYAMTSKEHEIPEDYRELVLKDIVNCELKEKIDNSFSQGIINCLLFARTKGKEKIDEEAIDKYFTRIHNNFSECKAYRGVVMKINGEAVIQTPEGQRNYKTILEPNLKIGNVVTVHGDYVVKVVK